MGVTRIEVFDRAGAGETFLGMPVKSPTDLVPGDYVKVAVAFSGNPDAYCQELYDLGVSQDQVITLLQRATPQAGSADGPVATDGG